MITLDETPEEAAWLSEVNIGRHAFTYEENRGGNDTPSDKTFGEKSLSASVVFQPVDWHKELIDTIAPPLAKAYAKAMFEEVGSYVKGRGIEKEEKHGSHNQMSHGRGGSGAGGGGAAAKVVIAEVEPGASAVTASKLSPAGELIRGSVAGLPITAKEHGIVGKMTKKTTKGLEEALSDPGVMQDIKAAGIREVRIDTAAMGRKLGAPTSWAGAFLPGKLVLHTRSAEAIAKRPNEEIKKHGLKRTIAHEAGHGVWSKSSKTDQSEFAQGLQKSPEVVDYVSSVVSVKAIPSAFANTGSRVVTESFAEVSAVRRYNKAKYAAFPDSVKSPLERMHKSAGEAADRYLAVHGKSVKHGSHDQLSHGRGGSGTGGGALNVSEYGYGHGEPFLKELGGGSQDLAALAGGAPGDDIQISYSKNNDGDHEAIIEITGKDDTHDATRIVTIDSETGEKSMMNSTFNVLGSNKGKGIGTKLLHRQVKKAAELGIASIETEAVGGEGSSFNGYYTWARLGYDGKIGSSHAQGSRKIKASFPEAVRISDLMKTKEGRSTWKEHGGTFEGSFDTRPGSQSRKVLDSYVKQRFGEEGGKSTRDGEKGRSYPGLDLGQHRQVKASTASEYIATFDDSPLEDLSFTTPFGNHSMAFVSEYPEWMKKSIQEYLTETFSQDYWTEVNMTTLGDITAFLRQGAVDGLSIEQMAKNMMDQFIGSDRYSKIRGRRIARTEIGHALNGARTESMQKLKDEVGDQLPMRRGWLSVLGRTTRDTHANLDGVPEDENGEWLLGGVRCRWPSDSRLSAGERINCFPGFVSVSGCFEGAQRAWYDGVITKIITAAGNTLTVTPNHPIMTTKGFVAAGSLQTGDQLITHKINRDSLLSVDASLDEKDNEPPQIQQVFKAFLAGARRSGSVEICRAEMDDFYGDGKSIQSDVDIVRADWELLPDFESIGFEKRGNRLFSLKNVLLSPKSSFSSHSFSGCGISAPSSGELSTLSDSSSLLIGGITPSGSLSIGVASDFNPSLFEVSSENPSTDSILFRESLERHASNVLIDDVVEVVNDQFCGHVYDLQSEFGVIVASDNPSRNTDYGIVTSNCQCTVVLMYGLQSDSADDLISDYASRMLKKDVQLRVKHAAHDQSTHGRGGGSSSGGPLALTTVNEYGAEFETGKPVKVNFVRNTVSSQSVGGDTFQQSIEPAGRYMSHDHDPKRDPMPGWEKGSVEFKSPIVMKLSTDDRIYGEGSWKKRLQAKYKKTGKSLSKAIAADGFDAIVTVNKRGTSEIIDLTSFTKETGTQLKHMPGQHDQMAHSSGKGSGKTGAYSAAQYDADGHVLAGSVGGLSGVDFSKHTSGTPKTKAWLNNHLKKVGKLEQFAMEGDWDAFEKQMSKAKNPKGINKKIAKVQENLLAMKAKGLFGLPDGAVASDPPEIADGANWKKIGGKLGTEEGGTYMMGGKKYYVKIPENPERARNEVLTAKLYGLAGAGVKQQHLVDIDGKVGVAGEWMEDSKKPDWNQEYAKNEASKDFATHAWLNNRDAVGAGSENPMDNIHYTDKNYDKLVAIDVGGGLDWKGMGGAGKKQFDSTASEFETLRDSSKNETMAKVFGGMTQAQLQHTASKLKNVKDADIDKLVDQFGSKDDAHRTSIKAILKSRRDSIIKKAGVVDEKPSQAKTKTGMPKSPDIGNMPWDLGDAKSKQALHEIDIAIAGGYANKVANIKTSHLTGAAGKAVDGYKTAAFNSMMFDEHASKSKVNKSKAKPKAEPKPIKIDTSNFPDIPTFYTTNPEHTKANNEHMKKAGAFAMKGNISQLQSMVQTGEVKSPKVKSYISDLINNVSAQQNPPPPSKPMSTTTSKMVTSIKSAKGQKGLTKIGKWQVLGEVSDTAKIPSASVNWLDSSKASAWQDKGQTAWMKLKPSQAHVIESYTGSGYDSVNGPLRDGVTKGTAVSAARGVHEQAIPMEPGTSISRKHYGDMTAIKVGHVVSDKGILSTTTDSNGKMSGNNLWRITAGKGVKALPVDHNSMNQGEKEVLMSPNQRLLVTKVEHRSKVGSIDAPMDIEVLIHAVALPTLKGQCCPP